MAVVVDDRGVGSLNHSILELLLDSGTADTAWNPARETVRETNRKQSGNASGVAITNAELVSKIANGTGKVSPVMQFDVIKANSSVI